MSASRWHNVLMMLLSRKPSTTQTALLSTWYTAGHSWKAGNFRNSTFRQKPSQKHKRERKQSETIAQSGNARGPFRNFHCTQLRPRQEREIGWWKAQSDALYVAPSGWLECVQFDRLTVWLISAVYFMKHIRQRDPSSSFLIKCGLISSFHD